MKKILLSLTLAGFIAFGSSTYYAQDDATVEQTEAVAQEAEQAAEQAVEEVPTEEVVEETAVEEVAADERSFHQVMKKTFIDGGPMFMAIVLICFILGLAIAIERIIYLTMATTNNQKLLENVESALGNGGIDAAKEVCRNTSGPVAEIFYEGLNHHNQGLDMVEKTITAQGNVAAGRLEKGVSWISLFIALAPMLGFMGTVIGMIGAFDAIAEANNISPAIVAGGIKVALITTVAGLVVAIFLQLFYNFIVAKIDSIINDMEDASLSLIDLLANFKK